MKTTPKLLAEAERAYVVAPAGYGKTYTIAQAVSLCNQGKQLILTHTHAGVRSIREKLLYLRVPPNHFEVETIAGWSLRIVTNFPKLSGLPSFSPADDPWPDLYSAATHLLANSSLKRIVKATYKGLFVDEYQDCTTRQHPLILALAELFPCRILGDPLQSIFMFERADPPINWKNDVEGQFNKVGILQTPWRWENAGSQQLGIVLQQLRECLENSQPFQLNQAPIIWIKRDPTNFVQPISVCRKLLNRGSDSIVVLQQLQNQCIQTGKTLQGSYGVMETLNCKVLFDSAEKIDTSEGFSRVINIIDFSSACMTSVTTELASAIRSWNKDQPAGIRSNTKHVDLINALNYVATDTSLKAVADALPLFRKINGSHLYRYELWFEMLRSIKSYLRGGFTTLRDAAEDVRFITREQGRRLSNHVISRTLLVKGLEYDHVCILNANDFNKENFYVAMTRGCKSATVVCEDPVLTR